MDIQYFVFLDRLKRMRRDGDSNCDARILSEMESQQAFVDERKLVGSIPTISATCTLGVRVPQDANEAEALTAKP